MGFQDINLDQLMSSSLQMEKNIQEHSDLQFVIICTPFVDHINSFWCIRVEKERFMCVLYSSS